MKVEWKRLRDEQPEPGTEWLWIWCAEFLDVGSAVLDEDEDGEYLYIATDNGEKRTRWGDTDERPIWWAPMELPEPPKMEEKGGAG